MTSAVKKHRFWHFSLCSANTLSRYFVATQRNMHRSLTPPWLRAFWIVETPTSFAHGNRGRWYQELFLKKNHFISLEIGCRFDCSQKEQEPCQSEFWSLCQNCHTMVSHKFFATTSSSWRQIWLQIPKVLQKFALYKRPTSAKIVWWSWLLHIPCDLKQTKFSK